MFRLSIQLGNDAMQTGHDVAEALRRVADRVERAGAVSYYLDTPTPIHDSNGNIVGQFNVEDVTP